jgi:hypothetical protein
MESVLDKDLRDDMLKLVRYKILFVRREYEVAFPEQEDIVSDNMDGDAFSAWKVAEFIQDLHRGEIPIPARWEEQNYPAPEFRKGQYLNGIPHDDKKYLRVYYQVLERFPREKFKYEEQQIRVLEEIRDQVANIGSTDRLLPDPYAEMMSRLQLSADFINGSRQNLARCADKISKDMANILNQYRSTGHFVAPEISAQEIADALTNPPPFSRDTLDRFTGPTIGDLRVITPGETGPLAIIQAPPVYSVWGRQEEVSGPGPYVSYQQKITGSNYHFIDPYDNMAIWRALSQTQIDLIFNAWTKDLGFLTWSSYRENHDNQLRSFGYEMNGKVLWFNQMLNPDFTQTVGPLPIQPPMIVTKDQLIVSIDFVLPEGGKTYFCVYALHINFNFQKCSAEFAGRILKMKNELTNK